MSFLEVVLVEDSLFSTIVLNLKQGKIWSWKPYLSCLKNTLPLLSSLINKAIIGKSQIPIKTKTNIDRKVSISLFKKYLCSCLKGILLDLKRVACLYTQNRTGNNCCEKY